MIAALESVERSSQTINSQSENVCASTLSIASRRGAAPLRTFVMTLTRGITRDRSRLAYSPTSGVKKPAHSRAEVARTPALKTSPRRLEENGWRWIVLRACQPRSEREEGRSLPRQPSWSRARAKARVKPQSGSALGYRSFSIPHTHPHAEHDKAHYRAGILKSRGDRHEADKGYIYRAAEPGHMPVGEPAGMR